MKCAEFNEKWYKRGLTPFVSFLLFCKLLCSFVGPNYYNSSLEKQ